MSPKTLDEDVYSHVGSSKGERGSFKYGAALREIKEIGIIMEVFQKSFHRLQQALINQSVPSSAT